MTGAPLARGDRRLALVLAALLSLVACGKKGPPVAPETRVPQPPGALAATVVSGAVELAWTNPNRRVDNTRLRDLAAVRLYRFADDGQGEAKPAIRSGDQVVGYTLVASIDLARPEPARLDGRQVRFVDRGGLEDGRRYTYVATASDSTGRTSAPSQRRSVIFITAPEPPGEPTAEAGERQVRLAWEPPRSLQGGGELTGTITYEVLRSASPDAAPVVVTPTPIAETRYTDGGLQNEQAYRYAVRAVRGDRGGVARSDASSLIAVTPRDMTAPSPPRNVVAVPSAGTVRLAWDASPEPDVAGYIVYREPAGGAAARVGSVPAPGTAFADRDVPAGDYRYSVSAFDRASQPNESGRSAPVSVSVVP